MEPKEQVIMESFDNSGFSGTIVIKPTVFAVGYNDSFIIAKHHPDKEEEIRFRLFKGTNHRGDYLMEDPNDSIYLSPEDSIYQEDGKWYHISNGWSPSDTLKPYKAETLYSIIDIRNYDLQTWHGREKVYTFKSLSEFNKKRKELEVPPNLDFTIVDTSLQWQSSLYCQQNICNMAADGSQLNFCLLVWLQQVIEANGFLFPQRGKYLNH